MWASSANSSIGLLLASLNRTVNLFVLTPIPIPIPPSATPVLSGKSCENKIRKITKNTLLQQKAVDYTVRGNHMKSDLTLLLGKIGLSRMAVIWWTCNECRIHLRVCDHDFPTWKYNSGEYNHQILYSIIKNIIRECNPQNKPVPLGYVKHVERGSSNMQLEKLSANFRLKSSIPTTTWQAFAMASSNFLSFSSLAV